MRKFGKTGIEIYPLGFGCMRFPTKGIGNSSTEILEDESINMIRTAIDSGVNYIDTAYPYHGGYSEPLVAKALKDGYREKVYVATKAPVWLFETADDFDKYLNEQLAKLEMDYVDFYLLHALNEERFNKMMELNIYEKVEQAIADGRIKHIGFSYHDKPENFEPILNSYDKWDFVQIQLNYLDEDYQAGLNGYNLAVEKGIGIVIMEPLQGGKLANLPDKIGNEFKKCNNKSYVEWAFDYLWNMEHVSVCLSGMSTMEQVTDNIEYANRSSIGMLNDNEKEAIKRVQAKFKEVQSVPCTKCSYCMPCPYGVNIPRNFTIYNEAFMFEEKEKNKDIFKTMDTAESNSSANACVGCGLCLSKCPQNIDIPTELIEVGKLFA